MSFATDLKATALSLLTTYGRSIVFTRVVEGSYVTTTSAVGAGTTTTYTVYGHTSPYKAANIDGVTTQRGDIEVLIYSPTEPLVGDSAAIDTLSYRVLSIQKLNAQGVNIAYKLQLRV
jgi:hypothetical protein